MSLISATLGRIYPRYRLLSQWAEVYEQIIAARPISDKTKQNRRSALKRLVAGMGGRRIGSIRPHEIAVAMLETHATHPQAAKRLLMEAREVFSEAVNYGWIDRNPAASVKAPVVRVRRRRLTLDQWRQIRDHAHGSMPPWVARMMTLALVTAQRRSDLATMRFDHVWDGHLHVEQAKTGARLALPLALRLDAIGVSIGEAIDDCRNYAAPGTSMLRKHNGKPPCMASMSASFETAREAVIDPPVSGLPASLHECRSLSERLYREQGVDTRILLGHRNQAMTDIYNDDRGLSAGKWQVLELQSHHEDASGRLAQSTPSTLLILA